MFSVWRACVSFSLWIWRWDLNMVKTYIKIVNGIQIAAAYAGTLRISISYHNRKINWTHSPQCGLHMLPSNSKLSKIWILHTWISQALLLRYHWFFIQTGEVCVYSIWNSVAYITHKTEYLLTDRRWEKSVFSCFVIGKNIMRCKQSF